MEYLQIARQLGISLIISLQVVREYRAAATRPGVDGKALPLDQVLANVLIFQTEFRLVEDSRLVLDALTSLLSKIPAGGKQVHDANIVATVQVHGIRHLLTHNTADFDRFSGFITVLPLETGR